MVFEVLFFFVFLFGLGFWLITSEALADWRRIRRANRVGRLIHTFEGKEVARAEAVLGTATRAGKRWNQSASSRGSRGGVGGTAVTMCIDRQGTPHAPRPDHW